MGHSGSTIVQYLLSTPNGTMGLGELSNLMNPQTDLWERNPSCSCGKPLCECPVWKKARPDTHTCPKTNYKKLLEATLEQQPEITHIVDTSKSLKDMRPWFELQKGGHIQDVIVINLVKDVRGWSISDQNNRKRKGRAWKPLLASMIHWFTYQLYVLFYLNKNRFHIKHITISYDKLVQNHSRDLEALFRFCWLGNKSDRKKLSDADVHDVTGNRLKNQPSTREHIVYDSQWYDSASVNALALLFFPVFILNRFLRKAHSKSLSPEK
jgi:hypothetical protein